jgi:hypothetical protein
MKSRSLDASQSLTFAFRILSVAREASDVSTTDGDIHLAIRSHIPPGYFEYHLPLFITVTVGGPTSIEYERAALESERLYDFVPSLSICRCGIEKSFSNRHSMEPAVCSFPNISAAR